MMYYFRSCRIPGSLGEGYTEELLEIHLPLAEGEDVYNKSRTITHHSWVESNISQEYDGSIRTTKGFY